MLENGHIKLHRRMTKWRWYRDGNTMRLFLHLILTANWEDCDFETITVHRGQRVASRRTLAEEIGMSEREVRTAINHLISTNEVTSVSTSKYTVFTVINYDAYQTATSDRPASDQQATSKRPQLKKDKKEKKDKNTFSPPSSSSLSCTSAATEEEVKAYAAEIGAGCDASAFYRTMQEQGWQSGGKPVRNWKAVFRAWEVKDKQKRESDRQSENAEAYASFIYNE
ncbi:MAG: hypothetical protein ACLUGC_10485 [Ruminococcus callidus]|uniref:hypothetical protein n=1 Tax=Ruminococcus callidus TaxID=40519 RepID=UPI0039915322